jgi:hypothetical protein
LVALAFSRCRTNHWQPTELVPVPLEDVVPVDLVAPEHGMLLTDVDMGDGIGLPIVEMGDDPKGFPIVDIDDDAAVLPIVVMGDDGTNAPTIGAGLRPPLPSCVAPIGFPVRPTSPPEAIPPSEKEALLPLARPDAHPPDEGALPDTAIPPLPPPSKSGVEPDAPEVELPIAVQSVPDGSGLMPVDPSSAAPKGIPLVPTAEADPMAPRGEVWPMPRPASNVALIPAVCATAALPPSSAASVATISACLMPGSRFIRSSPHLPICDRAPLRSLSRGCCIRTGGALSALAWGSCVE